MLSHKFIEAFDSKITFTRFVHNAMFITQALVDSVLGFASEQMKESRKMKAEMLNEQAARSLNRDKFMFKALFGMMGVMTVIGVIVHIVGF